MSQLEDARMHLERWAKEISLRDKRLDVLLEAADLLPAIEALKFWGYLTAIIGLDEGENLAVLYVFAAGESLLCLKVTLERENPHLPSIYNLIPASLLQERELQEMFGINLDGIPDSSHLLLPDDWACNVYPLRKDALLD